MYCTNEKYKAISGFSRVGPWVGDVLQHRLLGSDQMRNRTKNKTPESVANTITEKNDGWYSNSCQHYVLS